MLPSVFRWQIRHRGLVLVSIAVITMVLAWYAARIPFNAAYDIWFLEDDPDVVSYRHLHEKFGGDDYVMVAFNCQDPVSDQTLAVLDDLHQAFGKVPGIEEIHNIGSVDTIEGNDAGFASHPLVLRDQLVSGRDQVRRAVLADPFAAGSLVARDGSMVTSVLRYQVEDGNFIKEAALLGELRKIIAEMSARHQVRLHLAGPLVLEVENMEATGRDTMVFFPLMGALLVLMLVIIFRRLYGVLLPLAVALISLIWTLGLVALAGYEMNIVMAELPPLLMVIGLADAMHLLIRYRQAQDEEGGRKKALVASFSELFWPCLFTSLTTAGGFISLLASSLMPIRVFGVASAMGVLIAFLITMTLLPSTLLFFHVPAIKTDESRSWSLRFLRRLCALGLGRPKAVLASGVLLLGLAVIGITQLGTSTSSLDMFRESNPMAQDIRAIDRSLGGTSNLEILIKGEKDQFKEPEVLARMVQAQERFAATAGVSGTLSMADFVKVLYREMVGIPGDKLPENRAQVATLLFLFDSTGMDTLKNFVTREFDEARISVSVRMSQINQIDQAIPALETYLRELFPPPFSVAMTGNGKLAHNIKNYIVWSQIQSFLLALVIVFVAMVLLLRSFKAGLLGMVPNVLTILMLLGLMGFVGITLNMGTVMIASIVIGISVDNAIHFQSRLSRNLRAGMSFNDASVSATLTSGQAIFLSSLMLLLGFCTLLPASFVPISNFGLLTGTGIFVSMTVSLIMLPALGRYVLGRGKEKA